MSRGLTFIMMAAICRKYTRLDLSSLWKIGADSFQYKFIVWTSRSSTPRQGRNMVYRGPIYLYFLALILTPESHFPQI